MLMQIAFVMLYDHISIASCNFCQDTGEMKILIPSPGNSFTPRKIFDFNYMYHSRLKFDCSGIDPDSRIGIMHH